MAEQLICNQQVEGSIPPTSSRVCMFFENGWVPEWPKGTDCKSVVADFDGSNPSPSTTFSSFEENILRIWRNWQTRTVQVRMSFRSCRFDSCYPHQASIVFYTRFSFSFFEVSPKYVFLFITHFWKSLFKTSEKGSSFGSLDNESFLFCHYSYSPFSSITYCFVPFLLRLLVRERYGAGQAFRNERPSTPYCLLLCGDLLRACAPRKTQV